MKRNTSYGSYVEGSSARKMSYGQRTRTTNMQRGSAVPKRTYVEEVPQRREAQRIQKRKREKALPEKQLRRAPYRYMDSESMRLGTVVFMAAMVGILFLLSTTYLNYQAQIRETKSSINSLKSNIDVLSSQNDSVAYDIDAYIDINRVIGIATGELGMVRADENQIKYFEKNVDEFMNQYTDVPEN